VVKPTHPDLNIRFSIDIIYSQLIILLVVDDVHIDNKMLLMFNFVNLSIKPIQPFECGHKNKIYTRIIYL
jgi:hypothetical protein